MNLCGLDVGTSGVKATVFDEFGKQKASAYAEYTTTSKRDGSRSLCATDLFFKTKQVLQQVSAQLGGQIDALAVASFGESFVMLDEQDNVLNEMMLYTDRRGDDEFFSEIQKTTAQEVAQICGLLVSPTYSISKLLYLKAKKPNVLSRAKRVLLVQDFINYMLCGQAVVDFSVASRTMLFDAEKYEWSSKMMALFGMDQSLFSTPVLAGTVLATVSERIACEIGVNPSMKIVAGLHDQPAFVAGSGLREGTMACSMGTTECLTPVFDGRMDAAFTVKNGLSSEPTWKRGRYFSLAYNPSSGVLIQWFFNTYAAAEVANGGMPYTLFESNFPKDPTRIMVQPYLVGSGTPYLDHRARLSMMGIGGTTTRYELYRAVLEALALDQYLNMTRLKEQGVSCTHLLCAGGGSNSIPWLQIKADVMQIPIQTTKTKEGGALGCAVLCAKAMGIYSSVEEASARMSEVERTLLPNQANKAFYQDKFELYCKLRDHIQEESAFASQII